MGVVDSAAGIHRIATTLAGTLCELLHALTHAGRLPVEVREFARAHKINQLTDTTAGPRRYPTNSTIGPMWAIRRVGGGIMGMFADPHDAAAFAQECRDEGYDVTIEPPAPHETHANDDHTAAPANTDQP